jgi:hypothetical protein
MTPLTQARGAMSFGVNTTVQHLLPNGEAADSPNSAEGVPTVVTLLVVGCSKKVVIYTWKDGESQDVKVNRRRYETQMNIADPFMLTGTRFAALAAGSDLPHT